MHKEQKKGEIIIYERKDGAHFDVTLQDETVWLTQKQIAFLFNVMRPAITKHLKNIFESGELKEKSVSSKMEHTAKDGKIYKTFFYNLDAIISVGYRIHSANATRFRIWATSILKEHILKGCTINEKGLKENQILKIKDLEKTIALLQGIIRKRYLESKK
ncbi:virulence RhuM family protein [Candidatus Uhrbacteria bacterium]|nr:virulence RhuM family protein [Candidatus Uhrbacteria bacterium]